MKVFYAGDSPAGGPANYLLAILNAMGAKVTHVPPGEKLSSRDLKASYDVIILSDYGADCVDSESAKRARQIVEGGAGFLMVGGWGSFSGPFGKWKGTWAEDLLPVTMSSKDDRCNFPSGALIMLKTKHPAVKNTDFLNPPAICGLNNISAKRGSQTVLTVRPVTYKGKIGLSPREYPLLVVSGQGGRRTAAFASDFAPHWCGGMVDWGKKRRILPVNSKIRVEVGDQYVQMITSLIRWLGRSS